MAGRIIPIQRLLILPFILFFAVISCKSSEQVTGELAYQPFYTIADSLEKDPEIEEWLEPYRAEYRQQMDRVIAEARGDFSFGQPESTLGNLISDMIRYRASHEMRQFVHVALIDDGIFQLEFDEGEITLGELYEFMPHSSRLVVLEMNGGQINELADEIARKGGVPVSGLRLNIRNDAASSVLVSTESPDPEKIYLVATSSYIANGNGGYSSMECKCVRHEHEVYVRDIIVDYMRSRRIFYPEYDLRIRTQ